MSSTILEGHLSGTGSVTLKSPNTNSDRVLDLPDASGTMALAPGEPYTATSAVLLNTANGYGSSSTAIRRFTNTVTNVGTDITYADSATLGATFTINTTGLYAISYNDQFTAAGYLGVSVNSNQLTTGIEAITVSHIIAATTGPLANYPSCASATVKLTAGDVVRAHTSAGLATGTTTKLCQFSIARVG